MGCEIRRTLYIQGTIPCGYWGPKLSEWRWCWMSSIWHIHLQIWLHHCIGSVWICPELQILKQLSLDLVQATVEAETIVTIMRGEREQTIMFSRPCMMRQSNWEQVSMCFHLSPDVQGIRCTEIMLRQIPNSIIGNSPCTACLSIILWKNWRTDSFSQNRPLHHSYQFQWICTKWLRMIYWSSSMHMSQTSIVMHFTWNAGVGKPVGLGNRTPKHIADRFGCWVVSKHTVIFHSDSPIDDSSDHCHCWKIFQLHEKNQTFLRTAMT